MKWGLTQKNKDLSLDKMRSDFDKIFDDFFDMKPLSLFESSWLPEIDVSDNDKSIVVKANVPGFSEKDIDVTLKDNVLTISAEKHEEKTDEDKKRNYYISERRSGSFSRSVRLPAQIKADEVKAGYKNGVITIDLPKADEAIATKVKIDVK